MKILFMSDIHGIIDNLSKLDKIIEKERIDKLVVLGDLYYTGFNHIDKKVDVFGVRQFLSKYKKYFFFRYKQRFNSVYIAG